MNLWFENTLESTKALLTNELNGMVTRVSKALGRVDPVFDILLQSGLAPNDVRKVSEEKVTDDNGVQSVILKYEGQNYEATIKYQVNDLNPLIEQVNLLRAEELSAIEARDYTKAAEAKSKLDALIESSKKAMDQQDKPTPTEKETP